MVCPSSLHVEQFVLGRLGADDLSTFEAHVEGCEECFLRLAVAAAEAPEAQRLSLVEQLPSSTSRAHEVLESTSKAGTTLPEEPAAAATSWPRNTIGPYLVTGLLGVGGMSMVYRGRHETTGQEAAVKAVKMPLMASFLAMLRQEIEFLREAHHPGIVTVLDSDLLANDPWYAMELFEGPSLHSFVRELWPDRRTKPGAEAAGGRLAEVLRLFARLCDPVAFIHGAGLVHGDIKPTNIFLRDDGQPVLMDFGLASRARGMVGRDALDVTGRIRGTLPYIAPETIRGRLPDARADLYALGCLLYECLVGQPPFVSTNGSKIIDQHLSLAPVPASQRVTGVPPLLDELLLRLLAKNPQERFGHARALGATLAAIADGLLGVSSSTEMPVFASEASMPLFRPPMVGREAELTAILERVHRIDQLGGATFLVSGESGIGKTFFTAEVAQRALLSGVQVVTGDCIPLTSDTAASASAGSTPLQPFRRFFQLLRDRCHERGPAEVERLFGSRLDLLAEYVPSLLQLRSSVVPWEPPARLPAQAARERIVVAVVDTLVSYASGRSVLLAIDDLQWADDLSLAVLHRLDDQVLAQLPLIVVATYRSDEASDTITSLAGRPATRELRLGRLSRPDIGAIVGGMLSVADPPRPLVEFVDAQAEGVPFFAAEYLRSLVAGGLLVYHDGGWAPRAEGADLARDAKGAPLPRTLHELLQSRLDRLPRETLSALEAAVVIGRRFSAGLVGRVLGKPSGEITGALASAIAAHVTEADGFDGYAFAHDKLRETLYTGLAAPRRQALHLATAQAIESDAAIAPNDFGPIGHHLRLGGEPARALDYLERAGEHALTLAANADAERFFREALELEATLPARVPALRRARWLRLHGDALQGLGSMADSAVALKASAQLLGQPFPGSGGAFVFKLTRELLRQAWHRWRPRALAPARLDAGEALAEVVRVFDRMHQASFYLGKDADLVFSTTVSLNASERATPTPSLAVAYTNAAMMAAVVPWPKLADRYFQLASDACTKTPDAAAESWLLLMEGAYRTWLGHRERSISCLERTMSILHDTGFLRRWDEAMSVRTGIDVFAGFHAEAQPRLDVLEANARKRRDPQIECWAHLQRMETHIAGGDLGAAAAALARAKPLLAAQARPEHIWALGFEAYLGHERGEVQAAEAAVTEAIALIRKGPPVHSYCASAYDRVAEVALGLCHEASDQTRKPRLLRARAACAILAQAKRVFPIVRPAEALHAGRLALLQDKAKPAEVLRRWRAGAQAARDLDLPFSELRLCRAIVSLAAREGLSCDDERERIPALVAAMNGQRERAAHVSAGALGRDVEVERKRHLA